MQRIAGGYAIYGRAGSPITQAVGIGLEGPVSKTSFRGWNGFIGTKTNQFAPKSVLLLIHRSFSTSVLADIVSLNFQM